MGAASIADASANLEKDIRMLILAAATDLLSVLLASNPVSGLPCLISYRDVNLTDYTPGRQITSVTTNAATTILSSPPANTQRVIDYISIHNPNAATASVSVRS